MRVMNFIKKRLNFSTNSSILTELNAIATEHMPHPYILDLLDVNHREDTHNMFKYVAYQNPNIIFVNQSISKKNI